MVLEQIITIIIIALVVVFAWAIFKKVFKLMFYVGLIIMLLILLNVFFLYQDVADLRENFNFQTKKVFLVDKDEVITGFLLEDKVKLLTPAQLDDYSLDLKGDDYEKILGDGYKLMIFDIDIISKIENDIEFEYELISAEEAIEFLKSEDVAYADERKASLFSIILADEILDSKNPLFFFSEFKKGNIIIYPETALFKTIKFIPIAFFKDIGKKILEKTKEKAKTFVVEESE